MLAESFMEKLPGDDAQKLSQIRAAYAYMMLSPGMQDDGTGQRGSGRTWRNLFMISMRLYRTTSGTGIRMDDDYDGFEWIQLMKYEENVLTFMRKTEKPEETLLAVCNFAAVPYEDYQVGVPFYGKYKEIFNSDRKGIWRSGNCQSESKNL